MEINKCYISNENYDLFTKSYDVCQSVFNNDQNILIYLVCDENEEDICIGRIENRKRKGEDKITKEYLVAIKNLYAKFFNDSHYRYKFRIDFNSFLIKNGFLLLNFINALAKNDVKGYFKMEIISIS